MISACLMGICCRYDGKHSACASLLEYISSVKAIPFCPEQLGGLSTPRSPANIKGGDGHDVLLGNSVLVNKDGKDVSDAFVKGAFEALKIARLFQCRVAVMKGKSPSCGLKTPYCEKVGGLGYGVTAALFEMRGITVLNLNEEDLFPTEDFLNAFKRVQI